MKFVHLDVCLPLLLLLNSTKAFEWLKLPGTVHACLQKEAVFSWHYNSERFPDVPMIYWRFMKTGNTVLGHILKPSESLDYYDYGPDRVELPEPELANAGLILKKVQRQDEGQYRVEISGHGAPSNIATLKVYSVQQLEPRLQVNNVEEGFETSIDVTNCRGCVVVLTTANGLQANINITSETSSVECTQKTTCSMVLAWDRGEKEKIVTFDVDYGFCDKLVRQVEVFRQHGENGTGPYPPDNNYSTGSGPNTPMIIGVVVGGLLTIILILIIVICILWRRVNKRSKCGETLTHKEEVLMRTLSRWRRPSKRVRQPGSPPEVSGNGAPLNQPPDGTDSQADPDQSHSHLLGQGKPSHWDTENRPAPDGEDGPRVTHDPEAGSRTSSPDGATRLREGSPSTDEAVEATESNVGSESPSPCERFDSVDSNDFVIVTDDLDEVSYKPKPR